MKRKFEKYTLNNLYIKNELKKYNKNELYNQKRRIIKKGTNRILKNEFSITLTFGEEIKNIEENILENINECKAKREKDILILIDFNIFSKTGENIYTKTYKIETFIEETILIINDLPSNDRFSLLIYNTEYHLICPLMVVNKIDINCFSKDLMYYKNITFKEKNESNEYDINSNDFKNRDNEFNFNLGDNSDEYIQEESLELNDEEKNYNKIKGLINAINYLNKYSKMKEGVKNEKYIILFTDMINTEFITDEYFELMKENLNEDKEAIFLLVGKNEKIK